MSHTGGFVATYFDGVSAARRQVVARRDGDGLKIVEPGTGGTLAVWPVDRLIEHREERDTGVLVLGPRDGDARLQVTGDGIIRDLRSALPDLAGEGVPWPMVRKVAFFGIAGIGSVVLLIFVILPAMAGTLARMIPPEQEIAFGESVHRQIEWFLGAEETGELVCTGTEGRSALEALTDRVADPTGLHVPLTVTVFDHSLVNAFALPGGQVVIFRGLIEAAETPDEVAAVLAHEIGHVAARDPTRIALQTAGSAGLLGLVLGDFAGGTIALALANQLISANYSQEAETAADAYAHERLRQAGLPPEALGTMFERLQEEFGESSGFVTHFSSHPRLADRIAAARDAPAPRTPRPSLTEPEWDALRSICDD